MAANGEPISYYMGITNTPNTAGGTTTVPQPQSYPWPNPHVCPGCGRCKDCGRPYEAAPYNPTPWPGYPNPYIGDPVYPYGGPTWTGTSSISSAKSGIANVQVWN